MQAINKDNLLKKVGQNLRQIRKEKQLEIKEVVNKLNISPQAYSNIENGKVDLNMSRLADIANVLQVDATRILNDSGDTITNNTNNNTGGYNVSNGTLNVTDEKLLQNIIAEVMVLKDRLAQVEAQLLKKK
jgi:transcriptional regulator with XRE-family HTH domain